MKETNYYRTHRLTNSMPKNENLLDDWFEAWHERIKEGQRLSQESIKDNWIKKPDAEKTAINFMDGVMSDMYSDKVHFIFA
jgi:hypothetical protein